VKSNLSPPRDRATAPPSLPTRVGVAVSVLSTFVGNPDVICGCRSRRVHGSELREEHACLRCTP
jgi:hypothetical protein